MIRAYLLAFLLLGLGLAGVAVIATQASGALTPKPAGAPPQNIVQRPGARATMGAGTTRRARPGRPDAAVVRVRPRATPDGAVPKSPDAAVPKSPDAAVPKSPDAAAPARPVAAPDAAVASAGPPKHAGTAPALVVDFSAGSTRPPGKIRRAIRTLVKAHGYKDVHYKLTGYGGERRRPKRNRALARRRCRKVARLIRKRGVSRRWIECGAPVFRNVESKPTEADRAPAWRRVEIRVVKP